MADSQSDDRIKAAGTRPPMLPLSRDRKGRIDNLGTWFDEMTIIDNVPPSKAARLVADAALPADPPNVPRATKVMLVAIMLVLLGLTLPALFWAVGNLIIPMYEWSLAWAR